MQRERLISSIKPESDTPSICQNFTSMSTMTLSDIPSAEESQFF